MRNRRNKMTFKDEGEPHTKEICAKPCHTNMTAPKERRRLKQLITTCSDFDGSCLKRSARMRENQKIKKKRSENKKIKKNKNQAPRPGIEPGPLA